MAETLDERIHSVVQEDVIIVPYDHEWPGLFLEGKR